MRKFLFVAVAMTMALFASCHIEKHEGVSDCDSVSVKRAAVINLAGDVDIRTTRGNGMRYVALKVLRFDIVAGDTLYYPYAEGVFTTAGPYRLTVNPAHRYKVVAAVIENGFDFLHVTATGSVGEPFARAGATIPVANEMNYVTNNLQTTCTVFRVRGDKLVKYPEMEFFRGETVVAAGASDIAVQMARRNIALRFMIQPPAGGSLKVSSTAPAFSYDVTTAYVYDTRYFAVPDGEMAVPVNFSVVWTDGNGAVHDYSPATKFLTAGSITSVKVDISGRASEAGPGEGGVSLTYSSEMKTGNDIKIN